MAKKKTKTAKRRVSRRRVGAIDAGSPLIKLLSVGAGAVLGRVALNVLTKPNSSGKAMLTGKAASAAVLGVGAAGTIFSKATGIMGHVSLGIGGYGVFQLAQDSGVISGLPASSMVAGMLPSSSSVGALSSSASVSGIPQQRERSRSYLQGEVL